VNATNGILLFLLVLQLQLLAELQALAPAPARPAAAPAAQGAPIPLLDQAPPAGAQGAIWFLTPACVYACFVLPGRHLAMPCRAVAYPAILGTARVCPVPDVPGGRLQLLAPGRP